MNGLLGLVCWP